MPPMRKLVLTIATVLALLGAVGCGSDSSSTGDSSTSSKPFRIPNNNPPIRYESKMRPKPSGLVGPETKPIIPDSPPPEFMALTDLKEGIGHPYYDGEPVSVQYVGYDYETGEKFASSWDEGKPFTFTFGAGELVEGWEEGLVGLEGGDSRELIIPPELTAGSNPPGIPQGRTVVFVIDPLPFEPKAKSKKPTAAKKQSSSQAAEEPAAAAKPASSKSKPKVKVPKGAPPKKLATKDLEAGKGPAAKKGDQVTVQYVGVNYKNGKEFDASWDRGEPFTFELGSNTVIQGWEQGVAGMKAGGRRELIIPPELGYGPAGSPPAIPPNETLVFVVDLLEIN
jgi:FKBP-type peptidyl-prolyl cis-trans isomerase